MNNTSRRRRDRLEGLAGAAIVVLLLSARPAVAVAQTGATVFRACYVPGIGAMYMIGETGLPPACLSATHEQISWTESGDGAVTVLDGSITTEKLAERAVTAEKIDISAVGADQIADAAIDSEKIADGAIDALDLKIGAVTSDRIAANAVKTDQLANGVVSTAKIADGAVGTAKIANGAVSGAKIASAAVGSDAIADRGVTSSKIAKGAVTDFELAANAVQAAHIAANAVGRSEIQADAVDGSKLDVGYSVATTLAQQVNANSVRTLSATCDSGLNVIGGGYESTPPRGIATAQYPILGNTWQVEIWNQTPGGILVAVYAICADLQ